LSQANSRFESSVRGYDKDQVDSELKRLNAEIVRLSSLNQEISAELKAVKLAHEDALERLSHLQRPDYTSLGAQASRILSDAEQIAANIVSEKNAELESRQQTLEDEYQQRRDQLEADYSKTIKEAEKRAKAWTQSSQLEAGEVLEHAKEQALAIVQEAEKEAGRLRGQAATEVAGMRVRAKRELALQKAELEQELANLKLIEFEKLSTKDAEQLISKAKLAEIEKLIAEQSKNAEASFKQKADDALHEAQEFVASAQQNVNDLLATKKRLLLEIETLEMAAVTENQKQVEAAREKAEAIVHKAELQAAAIEAEANEKFRQTEKEQAEKLRKLTQQSDSIEQYIFSLKQKLSEIDVSAKEGIDAD
jgi:hypothetical protein